jgi:hypothetical protein
MGPAVTSGGGSAIPEAYNRDSWRVSAIGAPGVGFLSLHPGLLLGRSQNLPGGSGEESTRSETKRALLMGVSNLTIKRKNLTGWHIRQAGGRVPSPGS